MKFKTIYKLSAKLDNSAKHNTYPNGLSHRVGYLIDSARINADDTVFTEKAADEAKYDSIAVSSLECLLCDCRDEEVTGWFKKKGFKF